LFFCPVQNLANLPISKIFFRLSYQRQKDKELEVLNSQDNHKYETNSEPSQMENSNWDSAGLVVPGDAIYDYERVPAVWSGFDEQPTVYQYGDVSAWQIGLDDEDKLAS